MIQVYNYTDNRELSLFDSLRVEVYNDCILIYNNVDNKGLINIEKEKDNINILIHSNGQVKATTCKTTFNQYNNMNHKITILRVNNDNKTVVGHVKSEDIKTT